jgi:hypothetical protein
MNTLAANLPSGATALVSTIPDLVRLYDVGKQKEALGIVNCQVLWDAAGLCQSVLFHDATEADRPFITHRIRAYNQAIVEVTDDTAHRYPDKFFRSADTNDYAFLQSDISDMDCYHPYWRGQQALSRETWNRGPFSDYQAGG